MDIKSILKNNGVSSELVDTIADTIKAEIHQDFVSKVQYSKKVNYIDELNTKIADLEAKANTDEYKTKYETLENEYNNYKVEIEKEKVNNNKTNILKTQLKSEGVNDKLINLLLKEFDLEKIELENENVKNWENIIKPVKENYGDLFSKTKTEGNPAINPPNKENGIENKVPYVPPIIF